MSAFASGACAFLASPLAVKTMGPNPTTTRGAGVHINLHPKENKIIYASGKYIVVRSLSDPTDCFIYRGHSHPTTVAKFSPNGYWVASADTAGKVRVWSWDNPEHTLKLETSVFNGPVKDIDWDSESKKIVAVGEGSELMAKVFMWDTGNSTGEIVCHNKRILSVSFKPNRPFRIMTGAEDMKTAIFAGPPFKLSHSNPCHTNFVNCIRFSPDGSKSISVGSDKKIQLYDGTSGDPTAEIVNAHDASIYSVAFSPDGAKFITSSADKTVKLWDISSLTCETIFTFAAEPQIGDMQVSLLWTPSNEILSVSLNGTINFLNASDPSKPEKSIEDHQVAITSIYLERESRTLFSGSFDGVIIQRSLLTGQTAKIRGRDVRNICGAVHAGKISGLTFSGNELVSVGWDDTMKFSSDGSCSSETSLIGQPCAVASSPTAELVCVATNSEIALYLRKEKVASLSPLSYSPTCIAILGETEIAVGGDDMKTHIYSITENVFSEITSIETRSAVAAVAYSPNGETIAIGDNGRQVEVYERASWTAVVKGRWVNHTSRVTTLAWSPSGERLASGSLDESIIIWTLANTSLIKQLSFAHAAGVSAVSWVDDTTLVSAGNDHTVVTWNIPVEA